MENLSKYSPSRWLLLGILCLGGCQPAYDYYQKTFTKAEHIRQADRLVSGMGYEFYYQGSVGEQALVEEAALHDDTHPEIWRERGIPYLKRGIAAGFYEPYARCVELDPVEWQGWRGYIYLFFYRDYERAIADFNALDTLTPNFVDHPQSLSVDYMRGIAYLMLEQPTQALDFLDTHIEAEVAAVGEDYIPTNTFLYKALAHIQVNQTDEAFATLERAMRIHPQSAELEYHYAKMLYQKGDTTVARQYITKAKESFETGYSFARPYVEEFYQIYWEDLEEMEALLEKN